MRHFTLFTKTISIFITTIMFLQIAAQAAYALGEGPSQPEAMQFEPVDATDVVTLSTGDFVYTIPVLDLPGPEGNYSMALSYHSGIGTNQEATWVGLGWSLNPGAINRAVAGYPDDYKGDVVQTSFEARAKKGWGIGVGVGWGAVGLNLNYQTNGGFGGSISFDAIAAATGNKSPFSLGFSIGTDGFSVNGGVGYKFGENQRLRAGIGFSIGTQGISVGGGLSATYGNSWRATQSLVGFSISSSGQGTKFSTSVAGAHGTTTSGGKGTMTYGGANIPIPLPGGFWVSLGFSTWKWKLKKTTVEFSYGYAYQDDYHNSPESDIEKRKYERNLQEKFIYPSQDDYSVSAQGINAKILPLSMEPYKLTDEDGSTRKGILENSWDAWFFYDRNMSLTNHEIFYKEIGDQGSNYSTYDEIGLIGNAWGVNYNSMFQFSEEKMNSKKIVPILNTSSGKIIGFIIKDVDGKIYEFKQSVINKLQIAQTKIEDMTIDNLLGSQFASNWLITAIKGPDYIDRDNNNECNDGDWGYWVKFMYKKESSPQIWRSPYSGYAPVSGSDSDNDSWANTFSIGMREMVLLDEIETATHKAVLRKSNTLDRWISNDFSNIQSINYSGTGPTEGLSHRWFKYGGDWTQAIDTVKDAEKELIKVYYTLSGGSSDHYHIRKNDVTCTYINGYTVITDVSRGFDHDLYVRSADLKLYNIFSEIQKYNIAKKLDQIDIYNKKDLTKTIKSTHFVYDYSLCNYTPNSTSSGSHGSKLTLKALRFFGQNYTSDMPPYNFEYEKYDQNPDYHPDDWDNWGSYRAPHNGTSYERGYNKHSTPQDKSRADKARAWSLNKITTPTGGTIQVEYESDDYCYVNGNNMMDLHKSLFKPIDMSYRGESVNTFTFSSIPGNLSVGDQVFVYDNRPDNLNGSYAGLGGGGVKFEFNGDLTGIISSITTNPDLLKIYYRRGDDYNLEIAYKKSQITPSYNPSNNKTTLITPHFYFDNFNSIKFLLSNACKKELFSNQIQSISGNTVTINQNRRVVKNSDWDYQFIFPSKITYGGGIRVKSITTTDETNSFKTLYTYRLNSVTSSGVTASLPLLYGEDTRIHDSTKNADTYLEAYLDHQESYGRPSPGVIYSRVEVTNVDASNNPINGKSVYEFYTAMDHQYETTLNDNIFTINDKSGIYGRPKAVTYYELHNTNQFRPIKKDETFYAFSSDLYNYGKAVNKSLSAVLTNDKPLGMVQEKYAFENEYENNKYERKYVDRQYQSVYTIGSKSTEYIYDSPTATTPIGTKVMENKNFIWDALSGQVLASASYNSEDQADISLATPAYWMYPGMEDKNMLTQITQETAYKSSVGLSQGVAGLKSYSFPNDNTEITSSTVSTWSNHWITNGAKYESIWRKNDTYVYKTDLPYVAFNKWTDTAYAYPAVNTSSPWKMTSNIVKYDQFSHPVEEVSLDGSYTSALYGHGNALPIAIVQNAPYGTATDGWPRGFSYCGFENVTGSTFDGGWSHGEEYSTTKSFTGKASAKISTNGGSEFGPTLDFSIGNGLKNNTVYIISLWVNTTSPNFQIVANKNNDSYSVNKTLSNAIATIGDWKLIQFEYPHINSWGPTDYLRIFPHNPNSEPAYVDDIRVYPKDATMSTFAYDPLTWQVTAMTDANNVTTYYEYDNMGRLKAVYDQDKYLRKYHHYQYERNRYFETKFSIYNPNGGPLRANQQVCFDFTGTVFPEGVTDRRVLIYHGNGGPPFYFWGNFPKSYYTYAQPGTYNVSISMCYTVGLGYLFNDYRTITILPQIVDPDPVER